MGSVLWSAVLHAALHSTQPLQPLYRLLYIGLIQAKGYLFSGDICPDLYSYNGYLSELCVLCLAVCSDKGHPSILCSIGHLLMHTMQCLADFNAYYSDFPIVYIIFMVF